MNVASLELCKELYELSGWEGTHSVWYWYEDYDCIDDSEYKATCRQSMSDKKATCPAYGLGYLLRKLPPGVTVRRFVANGTMYPTRREWGAELKAGRHVHPTADADTPENALCELAIDLFKQGELKREVN